MSRETVCPVAADAVEDSVSLTISKTFGPDKKELVDALKKNLEDAIGGTKGVKVDVKIQLGPGC